MVTGLNKRHFNIAFLAFCALVLVGSTFRYLRIVYPEISNLPYAFELFLWFYLGLKLLLINRFKINKIDFLMIITLCFICISFAILSLRYGTNTQRVFFATYALPLSVYFYVRANHFVTAHRVDKLIKVFTLLGILFQLIEFYIVNYTNLNIFNFNLYWENRGVMDFHSSGSFYAFLGFLQRPWGMMAMPQSTGSVFSALAIYFLAKHFFSKGVSRRKNDLVYLVLSLVGIYVSGSRTAMIALVLILLFMFRQRVFLLFASAGIGLIIISVFVLTFKLSLEGFSDVVPKFFEGITINSMDRLIDFLFGQGLNSVVGRTIIGINENHLLNHLFYVGFFTYLALGVLALFLLKIYRVRLSSKVKFNFYPEDWPYYMAYLLFVFTLMLGAMHYDPLMRYPSNVLVLTMLGIISRDVLITKA